MLYLILSYLPSLLCGIHIIRSGREYYWLWLLFIGGPLGAAIYFFAIILPEWMGTRRLGLGRLLQLVDPQRDYRQAKLAVEETATVANRMKLAEAAAELGRWEEAEVIWRECAVGHWANDPVLLFEHAIALLELGRFEEAKLRLESLRAMGGKGDTPQVSLALARSLEGLNRPEEAEVAYRQATDRVAGLEASARYVAFLAKTGRKAEAEAGLTELEKRYKKIPSAMRGEARIWRDLAARALRPPPRERRPPKS